MSELTDVFGQAIDVNVGELQMYGNVNWLNALDELGKMKKNCDVITMLFVFRSGVLLLAWERPKGKRRQKGVSAELPLNTTSRH